MGWEVNAFMAMGITTALKIKNNKKYYSVNKTQQYKIFVPVITFNNNVIIYELLTKIYEFLYLPLPR